MVGELSQEFLRSQRASKLAEKMCQCYNICQALYRNDVSQFPHVWDGVGVESKIESVGEVCETEWPNVLKVSDANAIMSCGVVVFAVPDGS